MPRRPTAPALISALVFGFVFGASLCARAAVGAVPAAAGAPVRVLIDPGHGGADRGAERGDLRESQITLKIALKLAALLRADPRFEIALTRERDQHVSLADRARAARAFRADALLSIHANSNEDPRAAGVEIYFQNQLAADEESLFLAARENGDVIDPRDGPPNSVSDDISARGDLASILEDLRRSRSVRASFELSRALLDGWPAATQRHATRAIRQAPFYLVSRGALPSALVEVGFLTNPVEGRRLADDAYQSQIARQLFAGLERFKETVDKDRGRTIKSADAL